MPHRDGDRITTGAARRLADRRGLRWLLPVLDVHQRFSELEGGYLAAGVTLLGFLSLFPLVVVGVSVLGFLSAGRADLSNEVVDLLGLPPGGEAAGQVEEAIDVARGSREAAGVIGLAGLLWSGLGLVGALQHAYNGVWQVQGRGARDRVIGLVWLAGAGVLFLASFGATAAAGLLPAVLRPLNLLAGLAISFGLWLWSSHVLASRDVGWRRLVPGAAVGAVGLEVLKVVGAWYVPRAVASASALYGSLGLVFALLAWLFFFGRLVVYTAVVDVVHYERHRGTILTSFEVPRLPGARLADVSRSGRVGG